MADNNTDNGNVSASISTPSLNQTKKPDTTGNVSLSVSPSSISIPPNPTEKQLFILVPSALLSIFVVTALSKNVTVAIQVTAVAFVIIVLSVVLYKIYMKREHNVEHRGATASYDGREAKVEDLIQAVRDIDHQDVAQELGIMQIDDNVEHRGATAAVTEGEKKGPDHGVTTRSDVTFGSPDQIQIGDTDMDQGARSRLRITDNVEDYFDKVIMYVSHKWDHLARNLGFLRTEIKAIAIQEQDAEHRCREVLEKWRNRNGSEANLQVLKTALIEIDERPTAESL